MVVFCLPRLFLFPPLQFVAISKLALLFFLYLFATCAVLVVCLFIPSIHSHVVMYMIDVMLASHNVSVWVYVWLVFSCVWMWCYAMLISF